VVRNPIKIEALLASRKLLSAVIKATELEQELLRLNDIIVNNKSKLEALVKKYPDLDNFLKEN